MSAPMDPKRLAEIRDIAKGIIPLARLKELERARPDLGPLLADAFLAQNVPDLLAEVERLRQREPTKDEMEAVLGDSAEAFLEGTIRRCVDCREPIFGGPSRCVRCVARLDERDACAKVADAEGDMDPFHPKAARIAAAIRAR